jgi:dolichol-phosphate mannosyltransferase
MNKVSSLSILVPIYNDNEVIDELITRLLSVLPDICLKYEIVLIDDGSSDNSWEKIEWVSKQYTSVVGLKLIRNFGQQNAIACGLDYVTGDYTVVMDSDLQDRPEDIPLLLNAILNSNASMAIARWITRKDSFFKKAVSKIFYKVSNRVTSINLQPNLGVFRIIKKDIIEELKKYPEKTSTSLGLLYWIGVDYVAVDLNRDERFAGKSGYNLSKMLKLTMDRIFSFSMFPIRAAIYTGFTISLISFLFAITLTIRNIFFKVVPGWTSIIVIVLFLFGINFIFLGIIGEYLGRVFLEARGRPKYIIEKKIKND